MGSSRGRGRNLAIATAAVGLATIAAAAIMLRAEIPLVAAAVWASFFAREEPDLLPDDQGSIFSAPGVRKVRPPIGLDPEAASRIAGCYSFDLDGDGTPEILAERHEWREAGKEEGELYSFQVLRKTWLGYFRHVSSFEILGDMANAGLLLLPESGPGRPARTVLWIQGGSTWAFSATNSSAASGAMVVSSSRASGPIPIRSS